MTDEVLTPTELAILESMHDARGAVVFSDLPLVRALDDHERERIGNLFSPLVTEIGQRSGDGILGLAKINSRGQNYVNKARQERDSPIARATACRAALLAWVPSAEHDGGVEHVSAFLGHSSAHLHGLAFTMAEINEAADYLAEERLVIAQRGLAGMSLRLHHLGRRVLENWNGDIVAWQRHGQRDGGGGDTYRFDFGPGATIGAVIGRDNSGTVNATVGISHGLNGQEIAAWLASVHAILPTVGIESDRLARIEQAVSELHGELDAPAPREGILRRLGQTVLDELAKGAASLALPHLAPIVAGLIEAGKQLF
ncbi:hypothetical protein [Hamadaea tsunoensis]|uniref:hypothetical protein n=1 Tax=Hamadaea tsunoensis TaxID=53368 RepID=UPI000482C666|nr:hypothetical protein [Hamadaea tsunoensis]